jgi:uncharacterized protein (TIGR03000 family)
MGFTTGSGTSTTGVPGVTSTLGGVPGVNGFSTGFGTSSAGVPGSNFPFSFSTPFTSRATTAQVPANAAPGTHNAAPFSNFTRFPFGFGFGFPFYGSEATTVVPSAVGSNAAWQMGPMPMGNTNPYYLYLLMDMYGAGAASKMYSVGTGKSALEVPRQTTPGAALLDVHVPDEADVYVQGTKMTQQGANRRYVSPTLEPGRDYTYSLKAIWYDNGKDVTMKRQIIVQAGEHKSITFIGGPDAGPPHGTSDESPQK